MKKIFILLPDGVGLKNFAFTNFYELGSKQDFKITYWNTTVFDLSQLSYNQVNISNAKLNPLTEVFKNVRKHLEVKNNVKRFQDEVYNTYLFPFNTKGFKNKIRTVLTKILINLNNSDKGLKNIIQKTYSLETNTPYFKECLKHLIEHQPSLVLCTNQRTSLSIAPIEAAKSLGIKTACFIFSWDNLPKSMLVIDTDYYLVWSDFMKNELLKYYPHIKENQIFITGTPQFENHFQKELIVTYEEFCLDYQLDANKKYFLYSGDDITTSPNDPLYLEDTARAIELLNKKGYNFGIIFRRCPVDFSTRFDEVINRYKDIITCIEPAWKQIGTAWNAIMPTLDDMALQANCIHHTLGVLNLGSSMVFDAISHNKTCAYFNYNCPNADLKKWDIKKIYEYVHFRSMPSKDAVHWVNSPQDVEKVLINMLQLDSIQHQHAKEWFEIINQTPANQASLRIVDALKKM